MKPVKKHLSRFWFKLAGFFSAVFSLFITGCFLLPAPVYMSAAILKISGTVKDDQNKALIEGIRVKLLNSQGQTLTSSTTATNSTAEFSLNYMSDDITGNYQVLAEDIDGATNGAYSNAVVNLKIDSGGSTNITLYLHKTN